MAKNKTLNKNKPFNLNIYAYKFIYYFQNKQSK